jgi:heme exporter protein B
MTARPPGTAAAAWLIARKDLAIEFRTRTAFLSSLVFAVLALCILYFAWDESIIAPADRAPGVLWVVVTFSGLLGLQRSFSIEEHDRGIDALLVAPTSREAIYLGKAIGNLLFLCAVQAVTLPALVLFYNLPVGPSLLGVAAIMLLATIGIVAVGTLFSAMVIRTRFAELLLPVLLLPFLLLPLTYAVQATARLLANRPLSELSGWLKLLAAYDIVFLGLASLLFPHTVDE